MDYAVVTSPCDNVIHSLINTSRYTGLFLPGFLPSKDDIADSSSADHDFIRDGVFFNLRPFSTLNFALIYLFLGMFYLIPLVIYRRMVNVSTVVHYQIIAFFSPD